MHHSDVSGQSGSIARSARSTGYEPNLIQNESGTNVMSIADGDVEDPMGIGRSRERFTEQSLHATSLVLAQQAVVRDL